LELTTIITVTIYYNGQIVINYNIYNYNIVINSCFVRIRNLMRPLSSLFPNSACRFSLDQVTGDMQII